MSKVSIIYWSNGGNAEKLANSIAEGVKMSNIEVDIKHVNDSSVDEVLEAGAVALGSPAMVEDDIERIDMKPFINKLSKLNIKNKPVVLFGSCGWRDDKFIHKWSSVMKEAGFDVIGKLAIKESLTKEEIKFAEDLGSTLANKVNQSC